MIPVASQKRQGSMAYYYDGQPQYYNYYPSSSSSFEVPVTFPDPRGATYMDDDYRRSYHRHGLIPMEEVFGREGYIAGAVPRWLSSEYRHGGTVRDHHLYLQDYQQYPALCGVQTVVELYAPICCDECERKVRSHLKDIEGVESVSADQWKKKVVVKGCNLHPHFLLRRLQRDKPTSVFWSDRPQ